MKNTQSRRYLSVERIWKAFFFSLHGIRHAIRNEAAFQQELILVAVLTVAALALPFNLHITVGLLLANLVILIVELLNSSIEVLADRICRDVDPMIKQAKDMGSAAVSLTLFSVFFLWCYAIYTLT